MIFKATIEAPDEEVLDLDDNKQLDAFFTEVIQCIDEIEKDCSGNMPVFDDKNFRALFFDYYKQKKEYRCYYQNISERLCRLYNAKKQEG